MHTMKRLAHAALTGLLLVGALAVSLSLLVPNAFAQGVHLLERGTGGVGRLILGYGQSASGVGQDILLLTGGGAPTSGAAGTAANQAPPASMYIDVTNNNVYQNTNTKASPTWSPVVGDDAVRYATVTLTNAQILALGSTPITIVAAPAAGKFIETLGGTISFASTSAAYTLNSNNIALYYTSRGGGNRASNTITAAGLLDQVTTGLLAKFSLMPDDSNPSTAAPVVLQSTLVAAMTGGNAANTLKVILAYRIRTA